MLEEDALEELCTPIFEIRVHGQYIIWFTLLLLERWKGKGGM